MSDQLLAQAVGLGYQMAAAESNLGMYQRMQYAVGQHFKSVGKPVPGALSGSPAQGINLTQLQNEHTQVVRAKDLDVQKQMKNLIKDSVRISLKELGQIYYNSGFLNEAQQQWNKSLDISIADEDVFHMRYLLAKTACMNDQIYLTEKFSREALDQVIGDGADPVTTSVLRVILTLHWI